MRNHPSTIIYRLQFLSFIQFKLLYCKIIFIQCQILNFSGFSGKIHNESISFCTNLTLFYHNIFYKIRFHNSFDIVCFNHLLIKIIKKLTFSSAGKVISLSYTLSSRLVVPALFFPVFLSCSLMLILLYFYYIGHMDTLQSNDFSKTIKILR